MTSTTIDLGFVPRAWQAAVFVQLALYRFAVLVIHRRAGKTVLAVLRLIDSALKCKRERGRYAYIAPQLKQAKDVVWSILKAYASKVPGTLVHESELYVQFPNGARVRIYGADNPDAFRGLYFDGVVLDEVAQMGREVWGKILLPALSDRDGWALFIGTPQGVNLFSELYSAAESAMDGVQTPGLGDGAPATGWYAKRHTVYDTGVFTPEQILKFTEPIEQGGGGMTQKEFRQEMLCDFGASSDDVLIPIDMVKAARGRVLRLEQYQWAPMILGVDVAWKGGDRSVIFPRRGLQAWRPIVVQGIDENTFARKVADEIARWGADMTFVDNTGGYGGEVVSRLRETGHQVQGVVVSTSASSPRFKNLRAEMWWKMKDWVRDGGSLPDDGQLEKELSSVTYHNDNAANVVQLQSKDEIRETIGCSPDLADALALTFSFPVATKMDSMMWAGTRESPDWDPLSDDRMGVSTRLTPWDYDPLGGGGR